LTRELSQNLRAFLLYRSVLNEIKQVTSLHTSIRYSCFPMCVRPCICVFLSLCVSRCVCGEMPACLSCCLCRDGSTMPPSMPTDRSHTHTQPCTRPLWHRGLHRSHHAAWVHDITAWVVPGERRRHARRRVWSVGGSLQCCYQRDHLHQMRRQLVAVPLQIAPTPFPPPTFTPIPPSFSASLEPSSGAA